MILYDFSLTAKSISMENFCDLSKICENRKSFFSHNFCHLRYMAMLKMEENRFQKNLSYLLTIKCVGKVIKCDLMH